MDSDRIIGCFLSGPTLRWDDDPQIRTSASRVGEEFRSYLWGSSGLCDALGTLTHPTYGKDLALLLFEFYLNPIPEELALLKPIGRYRPTERSIGVPVLITNENFFKKGHVEREAFLREELLRKMDLVEALIRRRKLDTEMIQLRADLQDAVARWRS